MTAAPAGPAGAGELPAGRGAGHTPAGGRSAAAGIEGSGDLFSDLGWPPFGAVVLPWLVSRLIVALAVLAGAAAAHRPVGLESFSVWDGGWYLDIARKGYEFVSVEGQTPYPFFPLFPLVLWAGGELGLPLRLGGILVDHAALLLALWGLHRLVEPRLGARAAALATWSLALFPGAAPFSLVYPEAILLAASVWAFHAVDRREWSYAAAFAGVAALVRPNGLAVALSAAAASRSWEGAARIALPACGAVAGWIALLWLWTGDPLIFLHAKAAWHEVTIASLLSGRETLVPKIDLAAGLLAVGVLGLAARELPVAWLLLAALWLAPPLMLGIIGMPRYVASCFPVFVAAGSLLARRRPLARLAVLVVCAGGLWILAARIAGLRAVP